MTITSSSCKSSSNILCPSDTSHIKKSDLVSLTEQVAIKSLPLYSEPRSYMQLPADIRHLIHLHLSKGQSLEFYHLLGLKEEEISLKSSNRQRASETITISSYTPLETLLLCESIYSGKALELLLKTFSIESADLQKLFEKCPQVVMVKLDRYSDGPLPSFDRLSNLQALDCSHKFITNIDFLQNLTSLVQLNISSNPIRDLRPLAKLTRLQKLFLNFIDEYLDIRPLRKLTRLRELHSHSRLINQSYLSRLKQLEKLSLICPNSNSDPVENNTSYRTLEPLLVIGNLRVLEVMLLTKLNLKDFSRFTSITSLSLYASLQTSLDNLNCPNLQILKINYWPLLYNIDSITKLIALRSLSITDSRGLFEITSIASLTNLRSLEIQFYNSLDLTPIITPLTLLQRLILKNMPFPSLQPLLALTSLRHLSLENTNTHDFTALETMPKLHSLEIYPNDHQLELIPLEDSKECFSLEKNRYRGLWN